MQSVLLSHLAVETILGCIYERVCPQKRKKDKAKMQDIEPAVFEALKPSVSRPAGLDTLRQARNMVAHDGCTPSAEDTQRHMALARKTCAELVRVVWDEDINSISHIDLVSSAKERELLRLADGLLEGTVESVPGREGEHVVEPRDRPGAAAGIARAVWDRANVHLAWGTNFANPYKKSSEDRLEHDEHQYERRRAAEVIAVALGVSLADLKRFYKNPWDSRRDHAGDIVPPPDPQRNRRCGRRPLCG